ncbi:MAG TPA: flagellar hook-length control protein FliK [Stellaceae bacterium]
MQAVPTPSGVLPPPDASAPRGNRRDLSAPTQIGATAGMIGDGAAAAPAPAASIDAGAAAPAATTGTAPSFGDAIASHVLTMAATGRQEATLQLQPPHLGDISIRVSVQGRDVSAWFGAAQPQVQQAVSDALGQLQLDLAGAGLNLAGAWVGADTSGMQRQYEGTTAATRRLGFAAPAIERAARDGADPSPRPAGVNVYV